MSSQVEFCKKFCAELKKQVSHDQMHEDQLKIPVSKLLEDFANFNGIKGLKTTTEQYLSEQKVRPDISVHIGELICGHVELKNPETSVDSRAFKGRNKEQWERLSNLPNILYTNGKEWALYRSGNLEGQIINFPNNPLMEGGGAVDEESALKIGNCLNDFLQWSPNTPHEPSKLAEHLARLAQILREEAKAALNKKNSDVLQLKEDLGKVFIPDIDESVDVADTIAQTVTYSLLLARLEGANKLSLIEAADFLHEKNGVLEVLLKLFDTAKKELDTGLRLLRRSLEALDVQKFSQTSKMEVYFYEHFLRAYDLKLSKDAGIYYTPKEVVALQVCLAKKILEEHFNKVYGFADEDVTLLDPAVGTGAYLIEAFHQGMESIKKRYGEGLVPAAAKKMMENMYGIELLVGPYIVSHVQIAKIFREYQKVDKADPQIYLGDTLSSPYEPIELFGLTKPLTEEREKIRKLKTEGEVLVCLGNPPYDRQNFDSETTKRKGGWVRYGDDIQGEERPEEQGAEPILEKFLKPARDAGAGVHLKNLYNDYVYFWRWALWRLFERQTKGGIISFITASSYLHGPAFVGMREVMRKTFDELWVLDLGGDSIGARKSANVFNIQIPVAIAIGYRGKNKKPEPIQPARVRYVKITGQSREEKLDALKEIKKQLDGGKSLSDLRLEWRDCPEDLQSCFLPTETGEFFDWPDLSDLFPWYHSGCQFKRTWPIGETEELLERRWQTLIEAPKQEKAAFFRESGDRKVTYTTKMEIPGGEQPSIEELDDTSDPLSRSLHIQPYSFRSFDNQFAIIDARVCSRLRPPLWHSLSDKQVFFTTHMSSPLDKGPAINAAPYMPDVCHFLGRGGGKDIFPLYRDKKAEEPNITHKLLEFLGEHYKTNISAEDLAAYVYALLGSQFYTEKFHSELEKPRARIPITKDVKLFKQACELGKKLIWLHTYAQRFKDKKQKRNTEIPKGKANVRKDITEYPDKFEHDSNNNILRVTNSGEIGPVNSEVWDYEISGLKVLQSWLGYRRQNPKGKKSSKLDEMRPQKWSIDMTKKLIELIWILEETLNMEPDLEKILRTVIKSKCFKKDEIPKPSEDQKKPPKISAKPTLIE